jgi:hypothetical protein
LKAELVKDLRRELKAELASSVQLEGRMEGGDMAAGRALEGTASVRTTETGIMARTRRR